VCRTIDSGALDGSGIPRIYLSHILPIEIHFTIHSKSKVNEIACSEDERGQEVSKIEWTDYHDPLIRQREVKRSILI
jgi:hypothetical protein